MWDLHRLLDWGWEIKEIHPVVPKAEQFGAYVLLEREKETPQINDFDYTSEVEYEADIYDMIIHPDLTRIVDPDLCGMEKRIFKKEMDRVLDLSANALNNAEIVSKVYKILREVDM